MRRCENFYIIPGNLRRRYYLIAFLIHDDILAGWDNCLLCIHELAGMYMLVLLGGYCACVS